MALDVQDEPVRRIVVSGIHWVRRGLKLAGLGLRFLLQVLLALLIVLEEWGWRPLADLLGRLAQWRPWAAVETWIAGLPPYGALVAFGAPSLLLLPLKFCALLLIGRGYYVVSLVLFLVAKAVATALVARLFVLTQPKLMSIGWFAWGYERIMPWKEHLTEMVRASAVWRMGRVMKERARRSLAPLWRALKPHALAFARSAIAAARRMVARVRAMLESLRAGRSKNL